MTSTDVLQKIKLMTISALVSDDILIGILVLKGGNALNLAYDITSRGSIDIDFSMENDFTELEKIRIQKKLSFLLNQEFAKENYVVFDIKLNERPENIKEEIKSFWGGYLLEFKVISSDLYTEYKDNDDALRRRALPIHEDHSPKFTVDISKYEYIAEKKFRDIKGTIVSVYSPEMLAIEKLRALCQQNKDYKNIVPSSKPKSRARDFYDIFNISTSFSIDFKSSENIDLCHHIFAAKRVPLSYIPRIEEQREFHRQSWESVKDTVDPKERLKEFDFYFEYTLNLFKHLF